METLFAYPNTTTRADAEKTLKANLVRFEGRTDMDDVISFIHAAISLHAQVPGENWKAALGELTHNRVNALYARMRREPLRRHPYYRGRINIINELARRA